MARTGMTGLRKSGALLLVLLMLHGCASHSPVEHRGANAETPVEMTESSLRSRLQAVFERYQGVPYRYGGTTAAGFDCSGFINTAYQEAIGVELPRTTRQMRRVGEAVTRSQLQPGDLVFFDLEVKDQHAGIYMGNGRFIHASTSVGVTESRLDGVYWSPRFSQARRLP